MRVGIDYRPALVNREGIGRILTNLVENACKYGEPPITITSATRAGTVQTSVRDHGPAIPPEKVKQLFELYDRGGRDETDPKRGLGLGLPLSRELARSMSGDLDYENGAFVVVVPTASPTS